MFRHKFSALELLTVYDAIVYSGARHTYKQKSVAMSYEMRPVMRFHGARHGRKHKCIYIYITNLTMVFVCVEVVEMLTPNARGSSVEIDAVPYHRVDKRWTLTDKTGSSVMPLACSTRFDELFASSNSRLYNSFISALAAADALGSAAFTAPKTFPFPVGGSLPGTMSSYRPVSRSPVALIRRQSPHSVGRHESSCNGIQDLSILCLYVMFH